MRWRRWIGLLLLGSAGLLLAATGLWWWMLPAVPGAFYTPPPGSLPAAGTLIRREPFTRGLPEGAEGWRLLYSTTDPTGRAVAGSALVLAPRDRGRDGLAVLAWTHGTTGVARPCAPSLLDEPFANVPALTPAIAEGWAVVAPDYAGLGTAGVHGYLIGESQARSTWDAVRAARQLPALSLRREVVLWGHSQGGHAALWTGAIADRYPDAGTLRGVAALAPASDLEGLVRHAHTQAVGRMISSYLVTAYAAHYPELEIPSMLRPLARPVVRDMARRCMAGTGTLPAVADALLLGGSVFAEDALQGPLVRRLAENRAPVATDVPILLLQGLADPLVAATVQDGFVASARESGARIEYRRFDAQDHLSIVAPGSPAERPLLDWTRSRFAGAPHPAACGPVIAPRSRGRGRGRPRPPARGQRVGVSRIRACTCTRAASAGRVRRSPRSQAGVRSW